MGYILIEESLFKKLMSQLLLDEDIVQSSFSEQDYWMNSKEACKYLNISLSLLNAYRSYNVIGYCKIKEIYSYKRSDVYKLKAQMDSELVQCGKVLKVESVIKTEKQAIREFEEQEFQIRFIEES